MGGGFRKDSAFFMEPGPRVWVYLKITQKGGELGENFQVQEPLDTAQPTSRY
jgi:hypothetical protein